MVHEEELVSLIDMEAGEGGVVEYIQGGRSSQLSHSDGDSCREEGHQNQPHIYSRDCVGYGRWCSGCDRFWYGVQNHGEKECLNFVV